jgi:uncharacterized membrane protein
MTLKEVVGLFAIVIMVVCFVFQYRALNRIAFGRSVFISLSAIVMGLMVGMLPTISATIVSIVLLLLGYGMIVFMGYKSYQHLQSAKRQQRGL